MALSILASYDIHEDSRRAKVAALIQTWGTRIQKSVYICQLGEQDLIDLTRRVTELIDVRTDSFLVIRQCMTCWDAMVVVGQATPREDELYWAVL